MVRVVHAVSSRKRHKRVLKEMKGAWGLRSKVYRRANETLRRANVFAYRDRRVKKREFRQLWIARLSAACLGYDINYSRLMYGLKKAEIAVNRKMLSEIAIHDTKGFEQLIQLAKGAVSVKTSSPAN